MAKTAHEVALGVSVDSKSAEDALARLSTSLIALGSTFNGRVLAQIQQFNSAVSGAIPSVNALGAAAGRLSVPLTAVAAAASTANRALSGINVSPMVTQASQLNIAMTGLVGSVSGLGTAALRLATPLSTLAASLAAVSASSATLNIAAAGTQLQAFASAINSVDATRLARQIGVIAVALDRGSTSISAYPGMLASMARSFQRLGAVDIGNVFRQQITGMSGLSSVLTTALGPVQNYATALRTIASASRGLAATSSSIGALAAQAAGIQLLSNAITLNIVNLQRYATAMSTVASATATIARSSTSTSRLVTSISAMASAAPGVSGAFVTMTAAVGPFAAALRAAASSAQRLYTRLVQLGTISGSLSTAIGSARSSMGLFTGILGIAAGSIASQIGLLGRLAASYGSTSSAARSAGSSVKSSSSAFSTVSSVVGSLARELVLLVGTYAGAEAIKEFGKKILQTGADFDNAMGMVKAVSRNASDYSTDAFLAMEREAFRMGRTTTYSATQAAEALKELTQGGLTTKQAVQSLGDTLALAEVEAMNVGDASRIVTSMMAQFQASASDLTDFVDKLAKTSAVSKTSIDQLRVAMAYVGTAARSANQPFYEVVSAVGALSTAGVESSQAGTTLRDMLSDLTDTTSYSSRKLQALGLDMSKIDPRANKLSEIIGTLRARGIDAADAMAIFGVRGGLAAGSLITVYNQYLDVLNAVQNKSQGTAAIMQQDVTNNLRKDFQRLTASWDYLVNRIFRSGFGDMMRGVVQQAKDLSIRIADIVDTLKNASQFGDLGDIVSTGLRIGFGTAINYFMGALVAVMQSSVQFLLGGLKVAASLSFWRGMLDVATALGNALSAAIKLAMANFIKGNEDFSTSLIQNVMYAGDVFVHKMREAAGVMSSATSPAYQKARLEAGDADRKLMAAQSGSAAFAVRNAAIDLQITGSDQSRAELDRASKAYNAYIEPFIKAQDAALRKLEREGERVGIVGDYKGSREQFAAQARTIVGTAPSDLERSAKEDLAKAKESLPGALSAVADALSKGLAGPVIDSLSSFKPVDVISKATLDADKARFSSLMSRNAPTPASAPTKTLDKVTGGKVSTGVGEIKLDGKTANTMNLVVGSMKEVGSGVWTSKFGAVTSPLEKATKENTLATNALTAAMKGGNAGVDLKEDTKGITRKPKAGSVTEPEMQTDLGLWARTGKMPERMRNEIERVNAQQRELEEAVRAEASRASAISNQSLGRQNIANITSTLGTKLELATPLSSAIQRGVAVAFDDMGKPIEQKGLSLGQPVTTALGYRATGNDITTPEMLDFIGVARRGGLMGGSESQRQATPESIVTPMMQRLQTVVPRDEERIQDLMYGSPLKSPAFGAAAGLLNTPEIADSGDRYAEQQLQELMSANSVLNSINSNIIKANRDSSKTLVIRIT